MTAVIKAYANTATEKEVQPLAAYGDLLNVADVCELTGLCGRVVRDYLAKGYLPGVKVGSRWIIPKQKLIEYLDM